MPIRKRGPSWQVDVRLLDGTRVRRTYPTEEIAKEAEKALTPNPQQRQMARFLRRKQHRPFVATGRSGKLSYLLPGQSSRSNSRLLTSGPSATTHVQEAERSPTNAPCNGNSASSSSRAEPLRKSSVVYIGSQRRSRAKPPARKPSSIKSTRKPRTD